MSNATLHLVYNDSSGSGAFQTLYKQSPSGFSLGLQEISDEQCLLQCRRLKKIKALLSRVKQCKKGPKICFETDPLRGNIQKIAHQSIIFSSIVAQQSKQGNQKPSKEARMARGRTMSRSSEKNTTKLLLISLEFLYI